MTNVGLTKNLNKSAKDLELLVTKSKRKLLEVETLLSLTEVRQGKSEQFKTAEDLLNSL